ncbi:Flp pilus assembly pilin Flp [Stella humosa]|uniref:Flp pilus assembly pilin Flp n=2 Tax=Stella humosa TaxID=94 RepID=A0A3N1M5S2_9PROT|nr:Flp pilus assembly pilin Flp [Stella humosa]BBK31527.1 hypothetical protein STHU_21610 [Stella humosa]
MLCALNEGMQWVVSAGRALRRDERGVTALEYGVIAAVVIVVGLATVSTIGTQLAAVFTSISGAL